MFKSNNTSKLYIATVPSGKSDEDKKFEEVKFITELKHNHSQKKTDRMYFHNAGYTTSITTGVTQSLTLSFDYNDEVPSHKYLVKLLLGDAFSVNDQYIKIVIPALGSEHNKAIEVKGKATLNFKNHAPSGNADEIVKFSLDILPQDYKWESKEINA